MHVVNVNLQLLISSKSLVTMRTLFVTATTMIGCDMIPELLRTVC
eukprot:02386.XXX_47692_47826_1 [CDS] Oithona nana genome sequencing.